MVIFIQHERLFLTYYQLFQSYDGKIKALPDFDNELFHDNYILRAKYRIFPMNTQLISRPEKVCIFMITKTHYWSVLHILKLSLLCLLESPD